MTATGRGAPDFQAVAIVLRQLCREELDDLLPDTVLLDIPGMDSMRMLQAAALLEERFMVEIDAAALDGLIRVRDLLRAVSTSPLRPDVTAD